MDGDATGGQASEPLSAARLAEIRARADAATPGPWHVFRKWRIEVWDKDDAQVADIGYIGGVADDDIAVMEADGEFIAHTRDDIPALLAEVDRLHAALAAAEAERAQWREIGRAVAERGSVAVDGYHVCWFCDFSDERPHDDGCAVQQARALLASDASETR